LHSLKCRDGFLAGIDETQAPGVDLKYGDKRSNQERNGDEDLDER